MGILLEINIALALLVMVGAAIYAIAKLIAKLGDKIANFVKEELK